MKSALIGFSGFVGSTLLKQTPFDLLYRSTNIQEIAGQELGTVVCAGAPAQKWIANREPENDRRIIDGLIAHLTTIKSNAFVLISTVDVFKSPIGVDEGTAVDEDGLHAYGQNRLRLEKAVARIFPEHLIVRLPGLVGPGLRKNVIFDFLNDNNLHAIDSRSVFQFYPMVNLWRDVDAARRAGLRLVHLTAAPVSVAELAMLAFGRRFEQELAGIPARYDMQTRNAPAFGTQGRYQYTVRESVQAIRAYAESEPRSRATS